ncbi:PsbP-related protein [uncultured Methanobrevibacter sp.]|uniref:PsbP-related protein n=1 Tax=uncultured Methanobrevibacter sp. TaxID=253161 RepID=UPI0025D4428E|nr:PsbP-related protein [uncultured Methanobrevibacter sp.]
MNKLTTIGIVILLVIIAVFGYIVLNDIHFDSNKSQSSNSKSNESVTMLSMSKGGVTLNYPSNWILSQATSNKSIIAISKESSVDNLEVGQININVEKKAFTGDFNSFVNKSYTNIKADSAFNLVSSGEVDLNGEKVLQYIYTSSSNNGVVKQHKALWFERNNEAYVVMYSAPIDKYEANLPAADYIIRNIKIN